MRKALVLMMTTCILFAGCIEGLTGDVEDVVESLTPQCNDPTALNYDENDTNADTCISEDILFDSINVFAETMDSEVTASGVVMTMSGDMSDLDESLGMDSMEGQFTMISTTASNSNAMYSSTEVKMNGMTVLSQSWMGEGGDADGMVIQAGSTDGEFLMNSAMSWEDFLAFGIDSDDLSMDGDSEDFYLNIDTDSDNLVTWDEIDAFVIEADGGWESDEERDEVHQDFNNSDSNADGFLDENEFEVFFGVGDDEDEDDDGDDMDENMEGDMDIDVDGMMDDLFSMFDGLDDDCDASMDDDCGFPDDSTVVLSDGMDGFTFSAPVEEGQTMDMTFDCDFYTIEYDGCTMTGFSMDMEDGSEMVLEILSADEVATLLTIDTTLGYEALPFMVEEVGDVEEIDGGGVFVCDNGEEIPASWENDGGEDCSDGSDENSSNYYWMDYDGGYCEWEGNEEGSSDRWYCKYSEDDEDWDIYWYYCENHSPDWHCTDDLGLSPDHENSANGTEWVEEEVFVCDNGEEIPVSMVNNDWDDCGDGSDENVGGHIWVVYTEAEFAFEGALDDYNIVISSCTEEGDDMGETTLTCGEDLMSVSLVDAIANANNAPEDQDLGDYSGIVFLDDDESGTLSDGDIIGIGGNTSLDWNQIRLHSTSADAYSDENPLHQLPGFTAVLGVLSLMGAAMMGRRD